MQSDSENGYCNEFDIYPRKTGDAVNPELGLTTRVVLNLTRKIEYKNHTVNIDNYFTSYDLFKMLKEKQIFARGTAWSNRRNFPSTVLHPKCVKNQGDKTVVQSGKIVAYAWRDKKTIYFLSSVDDPTLDNLQVRRRQKDGTQILVASPAVVQNYIYLLSNRIIDSSIYLNILKIAKGSPILKSGENCLATNYRPISVLPAISKRNEKHIS